MNNISFKKQILEVAELYLDAMNINLNKEAKWWLDFRKKRQSEEIEAILDVRKEGELLKSQGKESEYNGNALYRNYLMTKKFHNELIQVYKKVGLDENDFFALTDIGCHFRIDCDADYNRILFKHKDDVNLVKKINNKSPLSLQNAKESILKVIDVVAKSFDLYDT